MTKITTQHDASYDNRAPCLTHLLVSQTLSPCPYAVHTMTEAHWVGTISKFIWLKVSDPSRGISRQTLTVLGPSQRSFPRLQVHDLARRVLLASRKNDKVQSAAFYTCPPAKPRTTWRRPRPCFPGGLAYLGVDKSPSREQSLNGSQCGSCSTKYNTPAGT